MRTGLLLTGAALAAAVGGLNAQGAVVSHWRAEDSPNGTADSGPGGRTLTAAAAGSTPTRVVLPGSGAGSKFSNPIPQTDVANTAAWSFDGGDRWRVADDPAFTDTSFTVELFFNASSLTSGVNKSLAGQWNGTGDQRSWLFTVGNSNTMSFLFSPNGVDTVTVSSALAPTANTDYYAAVVVNLADTSANGIRFYLQDLTNGGPLQTQGVTHAGTTLFNASSFFTVGATDQPSSAYTGLIDEVRLSDTLLSQSELLAVPEPSTLLAATGAIGLLSLRRRRVRAGIR